MQSNLNITRTGIDLDVCFYCSTSINDASRTVDHLLPESRGGIRSNDNKVPCCLKCNQLKGDQTVEEFDRALNSMIYIEQSNHKSHISYLKRVKYNISKRLKNG